MKHKKKKTKKKGHGIGKRGPRKDPPSGTFGALIRERRQAIGLGQKEVSSAAGITQGWLSKVEMGETCDLINGLMLCSVLQISLFELEHIDEFKDRIRSAKEKTRELIKKRAEMRKEGRRLWNRFRPAGQRRKA